MHVLPPRPCRLKLAGRLIWLALALCLCCAARLWLRCQRLPTIFVVTATYARPQQRAELTRLCNTLAWVPQLCWIVVEDAAERSELVAALLADCGLPYQHLHAATPAGRRGGRWPKAVSQRNAALDWLRADPRRQGVVYVADDDNAYDVRVFAEMRLTQRVAVWPVGLAGGLPREGPSCSGGRVVGFVAAFQPGRAFAIDMAGFAFNLRLLHARPQCRLYFSDPPGQQESMLLTRLGVRLSDLEPRADDCQRVLVWHTRTERPRLAGLLSLRRRGVTLPPLLGCL